MSTKGIVYNVHDVHNKTMYTIGNMFNNSFLAMNCSLSVGDENDHNKPHTVKKVVYSR